MNTTQLAHLHDYFATRSSNKTWEKETWLRLVRFLVLVSNPIPHPLQTHGLYCEVNKGKKIGLDTFLLSRPELDNKYTFYVACKYGNLPFVRVINKSLIYRFYVNERGLEIAVEYNHFHVVRYFLEECGVYPYFMYGAFRIANETRNRTMVQYFIKKRVLNLNTCFEAAMFNQNYDTAKDLIEAGSTSTNHFWMWPIDVQIYMLEHCDSQKERERLIKFSYLLWREIKIEITKALDALPKDLIREILAFTY
jgi:hypothetical protein